MTDRKIPRRPLPPGLGRDTLAVREGLPASPWGENSEALFLTSSFVQPDAATAAARFANEEEAFIYSRFTNPTVTMMERRLAALEGTEACIATASGMSAILLLGMGLLKAGDHVVCSQSVFGSTVMLFGREFAKFGVETSFVSQTDVGEWRGALKPNTRLLFAEIADQPADRGVRHPRPGRDRPRRGRAARRRQLLLHAGTAAAGRATAPTSSSIPAPSTSTGRAASSPARCARARRVVNEQVRAGDAQRRHDAVAVQCLGRAEGPRDALDPDAGAERSARSRSRAGSRRSRTVERVYFPGLESHPQHALAMAQQSGCGGAVVSFIVRSPAGGDDAAARKNAFHVIDSTRVCSITANLGDTKTTITHPASTSHGRLTEEQRRLPASRRE